MRIIKTFPLGEDEAINRYLEENRRCLSGAVITYNPGIPGFWSWISGKGFSTITVIIETEQQQFDEIAMLKQTRMQVLGSLRQAEVNKRFFVSQNIKAAPDAKSHSEIIDQIAKAESQIRNAEFQIRCIDEMIEELEDGDKVKEIKNGVDAK